MKIALVFPPQWDPRHPPLSIPTLAGAMRSSGNQIRAWDLNLCLYWQILLSCSLDAEIADTLRQYFSAEALRDYKYFGKLTSILEHEIYAGYDQTEKHALFWDYIVGPYSPNDSKCWMMAVKNPNKFPFYHKIEPSLEEIIHWKPELILITCISDTQIFGTLSIASKLRATVPGARIIIGGHAVAQRRELLKNQDWLYNTVDAICVSHGEPTAIALAEGKAINAVPNIIWSTRGKTRTSYKVESVKFHNGFEPDFSVLPLEYYLTPVIVMPVETARGCPWSKCSFCGHPQMQMRLGNEMYYHNRTIESVVTELRNHIAEGRNNFFFVDDAIPHDRFKNLSAKLAQIEADLHWICYLRLEPSHDMETFLLARKSGCEKVFFGLETGSERLMNVHRKGSSPETAKRVIKEASRAGLAVHLFLITDFPDESDEDNDATDEFLRKILPQVNAMGFTYDVFPLQAELGTPLYLNPTLFGAAGIEKDNDDLAYRFSLLSSRNARKSQAAASRIRIKAVIEKCLKNKKGLRHLDLTHDAMHLLLISAHSERELS